MLNKDECRKLAEALDKPEGQRLFRGLQAAGFFNHLEPAESEASGEKAAHDQYQPISIWVPTQGENGWEFRRNEPGPYDDHFAKTPVFHLEKRQGSYRVGFFGESVAAGYLLAPHLTPAMVLQKLLNKAFPDQLVEVLDFSKTNESLGPMIETAKASVQLDLDMMIFFAGNNWPLMEVPQLTPFLPSIDVRQTLGRIYKEKGVFGVKEAEMSHLGQKVARKLNVLGAWLQQQNIPAVWLIPEVNLVDWDHYQPPPIQQDADLKRWYALLEQAKAALVDGQYDTTIDTAWEMLALDEGTCPVGYRLLGLAYLELGQSEKAKQAFHFEVQAQGYTASCFLGAPQVTQHLKKLIELTAKRWQIKTVDLASVIEQESGGALPGRRFFYDYCHLTPEGIHVAMAALLEPVADLLEISAPEKADWLEEPLCSHKVEALACLGAAIHSCHRQVPLFPERLPWRYWLEKALALDSEIGTLMNAYLNVRSSPALTVFSKAHGENMAQEFRLNPQHGWFYEYLDAPFLQALLTLYQDRDVETYENFQQRLVDQLAVEKQRVDLVKQPYFLWQPLARYLPEVMAHQKLSKRAFLRCPMPFLELAFVCHGQEDLALTWVGRHPGAPLSIARIVINNQELTCCELKNDWQRYAHTLPHRLLKKGLNQLRFEFEITTRADLGESITSALQMGHEACFHPHFAELFSATLGLEARDC